MVLVENVIYQNADFIASCRESYQGKNAHPKRGRSPFRWGEEV